MKAEILRNGSLVFGKYRICRPLARGGMGLVYLARTEGAEGFCKPIVVKQVLRGDVDDCAMDQMFVREAQILSRLDHPSIVNIIDFGRHETGYITVLEYIRGYHLGQWLRYLKRIGTSPPVWSVVHIVHEVLRACHFAHTQRRRDGTSAAVVHRDISPANILVHEGGYPKLLDFGVASSALDLTEHKQVKGKAPYIAPELVQGSAPSPATDCYAAAVVLYESLAGENPFRAANFHQTLVRGLKFVPRRLDEINARVPKGLANVVARALEKEPEKRYSSAAEFADGLRDAMGAKLDGAARRLRHRCALDFRSTELPRVLNRPSLESLDHAWEDLEADDIGDEGELPLANVAVEFSGDYSGGMPPAQPNKWMLWGSVLTFAFSLLLGLGLVIDAIVAEQSVNVWVQRGGVADVADVARRGALSSGLQVMSVRSASGLPPAGALGSALAPATRAPGELAAPVMNALPEIRVCFESASVRGEDEQGFMDLQIRFEIDRGGVVTSANILSQERIAPLARSCLLSIANQLRFSRQDAPISFRVPIRASLPAFARQTMEGTHGL